MKLVFIVTFVSIFGLSLADTRPDQAHSIIEYLLVVQFEKRQAEVFDALKACNESFAVPYRESVELFVNSGVDLLAEDPKARCLVDCVMRKTKVLTDAGLKVDEYMRQVKQLRLNYTSYDINQKPKEEKDQVLDTIRRVAGRSGSYEVILTYESAANECKDKMETDNCDTAWSIVRCIVKKLRDRHFNAPFYPVDLAFLDDS